MNSKIKVIKIVEHSALYSALHKITLGGSSFAKLSPKMQELLTEHVKNLGNNLSFYTPSLKVKHYTTGD